MAELSKFVEHLRARRQERPFRMFEIRTTTGDRLRVDHAFAFAFNAKGVIVPGQGGPIRYADIVTINDIQAAEGLR